MRVGGAYRRVGGVIQRGGGAILDPTAQIGRHCYVWRGGGGVQGDLGAFPWDSEGPLPQNEPHKDPKPKCQPHGDPITTP